MRSRVRGGRTSLARVPGVLPSSLSLILMTVGFTTGAVLMLAWVWHKGFLRDFEAQARSILDERDLRLVREWEGPVDRLEREMRHGTLLMPRRGEWGGAHAGVPMVPVPPSPQEAPPAEWPTPQEAPPHDDPVPRRSPPVEVPPREEPPPAPGETPARIIVSRRGTP